MEALYRTGNRLQVGFDGADWRGGRAGSAQPYNTFTLKMAAAIPAETSDNSPHPTRFIPESRSSTPFTTTAIWSEMFTHVTQALVGGERKSTQIGECRRNRRTPNKKSVGGGQEVANSVRLTRTYKTHRRTYAYRYSPATRSPSTCNCSNSIRSLATQQCSNLSLHQQLLFQHTSATRFFSPHRTCLQYIPEAGFVRTASPKRPHSLPSPALSLTWLASMSVFITHLRSNFTTFVGIQQPTSVSVEVRNAD